MASSSTSPPSPPRLRITPIPLFSDNYAWRVEDTATGKVVLVDPADPEPCIAAVCSPPSSAASAASSSSASSSSAASLSSRLVGILTTHHHRDHSGGNKAISEAWEQDLDRAGGLGVGVGVGVGVGAGDGISGGGPPRRRLMVVGGAEEGDRVPAATHLVRDGEEVDYGGALRFTALHTPCHTRGHTCYVYRPPGSGTDGGAGEGEPPAVFTGDTLFGAGCGRFFEGNAAEMAGSLAKLAALPEETRVYFGHEYTVDNLRFCLHADPSNAAASERMARSEALRAEGLPTAPSTIGEELRTNVFLRAHEQAVRAYTGAEGDVEVLAKLREAKNGFK